MYQKNLKCNKVLQLGSQPVFTQQPTKFTREKLRGDTIKRADVEERKGKGKSIVLGAVKLGGGREIK
jgi:hypothetical protein